MSTDSPDATTSGRFAAFAHRSYVYFWTARFFATFAVQIVAVSVGWQVWQLTENPRDLGMIGLVQFLPLLLLVLVTGAVADRFGRRLVMSVAIGLECLCAGAILFFSLRGLTGPLPIFIALAGMGTARAFFGPASQSLVVNIVPAKDFANAVTWNASSWQVSSIVGPAAGGLLYGVGPVVAYSVAMSMFLAGFLLVNLIPKPPVRGEVKKVTFSSLFDGLRYIRGEKVVLGAISLDLFAVLLGGAVALMPAYADKILHLESFGLGMLRAAPGIGAIIMAGYLAASPIKDHAGKVLLAFVAMFGFFTAIFGLSTIAWLSIGALMLVGAADMVSVAIRETLLQLWTPDEVRGRVNAVNMVFLGASNELGEARAGYMAAWIGIVPAAVFGGVAAVGVAAIWAILFPQLRDARYLHRRG